MLQLVGFTEKELDAAKEAGSCDAVIARMSETNSMLVTDYERENDFV